MKLEQESLVIQRICSLMLAVRKSKKISQQELCVYLGITQGLLSKIENSKLSPSVYVWLTFRKLFGLEPTTAMSEAAFKKAMRTIKPKSKS